MVWDSHLRGFVGLVSQTDEGLQLPVQSLSGGRFSGSVDPVDLAGAQLVAPALLPGALRPEDVLAVRGLAFARVAGRRWRLPGSPGAAADQDGTFSWEHQERKQILSVSPQDGVLLIPAVEQVVVAAADGQLGSHWLVSTGPKQKPQETQWSNAPHSSLRTPASAHSFNLNMPVPLFFFFSLGQIETCMSITLLM